MPNMLTIRQAVTRLKDEGLPITEYSLRVLVKQGKLPVRFVGKRALLYYPNIITYFQCTDGSDNTPVNNGASPGICRAGM